MLLRNVRFEERSIVANGDVIIGQNSKIDYGIIAKKLIAGERVAINGDVISEEVRVDSFCSIHGDLVSKGDAYIGEFTGINGKLTVYGDLEIGRNVKIKSGFEARGLITIQNPASIVFFLFLYLMLLLRLGKVEEIHGLFEEEVEPSIILPEKSVVNGMRIFTTKNADIYDSRILGTMRARNIYVSRSEIFGGLRGREIIVDSTRVHGAVEGKIIYLINSSEVNLHVKGERVYMEKGCIVNGEIIAREGVWIRDAIVLKTDLGDVSGVEQRSIQEDVSEPLPRDRGQVDTDSARSS